MKNLAIVGSTGSIGTQTLDIVKRYPKEFKVVALSTNSNVELLKKQIQEFNPKLVSVSKDVEMDVPTYYGMPGLEKISTHPDVDTVVTSVVGSVGLRPTIAAIKGGKNIALANKETLVTAGDIVMNEVHQAGVGLMPIDSEHSAIWQCLNGEDVKKVKRIIITCSGGSFRGRRNLENVTVKDALNHPNWNMGGKITIDSATLMNKGLEVIEAHHLYGVSYDKIEVVIHRESIIHSMVEFIDGSIMAQLGIPDMRIPILYALTYPKRLELDLPSIDFLKIKELNFSEPDTDTFKCLAYAYDAGRVGGTMPAVMNAANEVAVEFFLKGKIKFLEITHLIKHMMDKHKVIKDPTIEEILEVDARVKEETREKCF